MELSGPEGAFQVPDPRGGKTRSVAVVVLLCSVALLQTEWVRRTASVTADETYYLSVAIRSLQQVGLDPDLIRSGAAPLPIVLNYMPVLGTATKDSRHDPWRGLPGDHRLIYGPRVLTTLSSLIPLLLLTFGWLWARRGLAAATVGAGLLAFSPTMLAHGSLATQDSSFAFQATLAVLCMGSFLASPTWAHLLLTTGASSLAIGSKYTGILLIPCFLLTLAIRLTQDLRKAHNGLGRSRLRAVGRALAWGSIFLVLLGLFTWALHGFGVAGDRPLIAVREVPGETAAAVDQGRGTLEEALGRLSGLSFGQPGFIAAIRTQMIHNQFGHPSFLHGTRSMKGWWYYYPVTMILKSTISELVLFAGVVLFLVVRAGRSAGVRRRAEAPGSTGRGVDPWRLVMLLFSGILLAALIRSHIDIGHRYTIALYPIAVLLTTDAWAELELARRGWLRAVGPILLGTQMVTSLAAAPQYLSYFNPIAGGPDQGWKYLADSNIDWGQDLPALKSIIDQSGYRRVAIDYFGSASLADHGVQVEPAGSSGFPSTDYDAFAISVTLLHSVYPRGPKPWADHFHTDIYRELRGLPPTHRAGHSIFIYDLSDPSLRQGFLDSAELLKQVMTGSRPVERTAVREHSGAAAR
jgi:hypothetical protein